MYFLVSQISKMPNKSTATATDRVKDPNTSHVQFSCGDDIKAVNYSADHQDSISLDPAGFCVEGQGNEEDDTENKSKRELNHHHTFYYIHCCSCKNNEKDDLSLNNNNGSVGNNNDDHGEEDNCKDGTGSVPIPHTESTAFSFRKLWAFAGPGLMMSFGYLDPGNIQSDLQSGAEAKYQLLWVLLWATLIGLVLQRLAARLGTVTGLHLAEACYLHYSPVPRTILWVLAEVAVIGAEMQEVIGSAIAYYLLSNQMIPLWGGVILAVVQSFALLLFEKLYGLRKLEAIFAVMISIMAISFGFEASPQELQVISGVILPGCQNCSKSSFLQAIAIIGSVIMPHNLYLHSALVKSRKIDRSSPPQIAEANKYNLIESSLALGVTFIVNVFIVSVFATGLWDTNSRGELYRKSNRDILKACPELNFFFPNDTTSKFQPNLYTGGLFLGCQYGQIATYIWALGILCAGISSTMTGTYAGQFIMDGFLNLKLPRIQKALLTRALVFTPPFLVSKFLHVQDLSLMSDMLNCLMSLLLPFAILPLISMTSNPTLITPQFKMGKFLKLFSLFLVVALIAINLYFLSQFIGDWVGHPMEWWSAVSVIMFGVTYVGMCTYLFGHVIISMGFEKWGVHAITNIMIAILINLLTLIAYLIVF